MITSKSAKEVLMKCLTTGADFAEIFMESTVYNAFELMSGKVSKANTNHFLGAGIRVLKGFEEIYGYTNDVSQEGLLELAGKLANFFEGTPLDISFELELEEVPNNHPVIRRPKDVTNEEKIAYMMKAYEGARDYSPEISQVICSINDREQRVWIANTKGTFKTDVRTYVTLSVTAIASKPGEMERISDNVGANQGYELLDNTDIVALGRETAKSAVTMLHAEEMVGQVMPVVVHNKFGGVLLHEACVHSLEATLVAKGASVFSNMLGQKIASDIVTAVDDGTIPNAWGSLNIDDEGNPTQRNVLIENGVLKSYLVDYRNSRRMNHPITGSGRRESYKYSPTSRMTNTFFVNGTHTFDEIIANTKYGLFAKKMGGGSVNPSTGEFNFAVQEAYLIENGKITRPVRGATLIGSGAQVLKNIDMIANNLDYGHGMCGSLSGSIPTNVGQPTIRVQNMTVGGRGGQK